LSLKYDVVGKVFVAQSALWYVLLALRHEIREGAVEEKERNRDVSMRAGELDLEIEDVEDKEAGWEITFGREW
jgi:hypothetical protein